jgi:hypothetical protein
MDGGQRHDRRQVLKIFTIGGVATALVMPTSWTKPLVKSVIVPAHAQASPHDRRDGDGQPTTTSGPTTTGSGPTTTTPTSTTATSTTPAGFCPLPNASGTLQPDGSCIIQSCNSGFSDCDLNPATGCEIQGPCE